MIFYDLGIVASYVYFGFRQGELYALMFSRKGKNKQQNENIESFVEALTPILNCQLFLCRVNQSGVISRRTGT